MVFKAAMSRTGARVPANRSFEREMAILEAMSGHAPDAIGIERVRKALGNQNNYLVAKASKIVSEYALVELLPEVLAAYDRFFLDPIKSDPQCWAKNALVKALVQLNCHEAEVYLRGLRHRQEEPVWGGYSDTAGALRGTCTHALVACPGIGNENLLKLMLEPFVDQDKTVRMEAARAIGQVGGAAAALLLRFRILLRKEEAEVLGSCFSALLGIESVEKTETIALVAAFMDDGEEAAAEAAFALAETHDQTALDALIDRRRRPADAWFGSVLDNAIALTRLPEGMEFLLGIIEKDARLAASALEAISRVYNSSEVRARVVEAVRKAGNDRVQVAFRQYFPSVAAG